MAEIPPDRLPARRADGSACVVLVRLIRDGKPQVVDYTLESSGAMLTRLGPKHFTVLNTRELIVADGAT